MPFWITFIRFAAGAICIVGAIFAVIVAGSGIARGNVWALVAGVIIAAAVYGFWRLANLFVGAAAIWQDSTRTGDEES